MRSRACVGTNDNSRRLGWICLWKSSVRRRAVYLCAVWLAVWQTRGTPALRARGLKPQLSSRALALSLPRPVLVVVALGVPDGQRTAAASVSESLYRDQGVARGCDLVSLVLALAHAVGSPTCTRGFDGDATSASAVRALHAAQNPKMYCTVQKEGYQKCTAVYSTVKCNSPLPDRPIAIPIRDKRPRHPPHRPGGGGIAFPPALGQPW